MARSLLWIGLVICMASCVITEKSRKKEEQPEGKGHDEISNNENVYSVCGLEASNKLVVELNEAYEKATSWIVSQRTKDWGWPQNTAATILSLQLTNDSWYGRGTSDMPTQLSVKQLKIELLADLSQAVVTATNTSDIRTLPTISPKNLAYYTMALNSTCNDVTDFYRINLVSILTNHMDRFPHNNFNTYFQYGLVLLALCQSGAPIKAKYIQEIIDGQSEDGDYRFGSDVISMAVMAMSCIQDKVPYEHRKQFTKRMKRSSNFLASNQNDDGTFGRFGSHDISTALATQALIAANTPLSDWNCEAAIRSVLDAQAADGDFGSLGGTIRILPLLAGKTFANIKDVHPYCDAPTEGDEIEGPEIQITLVIENGVDTSAPILDLDVVVPENASLYEAMVRASEQHPDAFSFEVSLGQFGHSIDEINGVADDRDNFYYWIILIGPERTSATTGIDRITTENGGTYILYYKWLVF